MLCLFPICLFINITKKRVHLKGSVIARKIWELAGGIAEEIFYNIKTVFHFQIWIMN